jgi:hypothetical protein
MDLVRSRREGIAWSNELFEAAIRRALVGQNWQEKASWNAAFRSHRKVWRRAYLRSIDWEHRLSPKLLERVDDEPIPERRFVLIA